nr:hypothetical protein [Tanacetum cinerariifolium]
MSRDVLTIGSTMRIPLLYRGEYSQWVERFMNYLEEQTDGEAMINSIKNGDQPLPRVTQVSIAGICDPSWSYGFLGVAAVSCMICKIDEDRAADLAVRERHGYYYVGGPDIHFLGQMGMYNERKFWAKFMTFTRMTFRWCRRLELSSFQQSGWLVEDLDNYHLKELHCSAQCLTQLRIFKRIRRWRYNLILAESRFKTSCSIIKDKDMMKAQGRLLASFQDLEHEGGDTRSQGGIRFKDNDIKIKIQDHKHIDRLARHLLIQGLSNDIYSLIDSNKTAKDLWDALARHMLGSEYGEQNRKAADLYEYETFKATERELLLDTYK